jgi:hypothetical protein
MRIFTASIIIGSFMLIGALPAAAGQPTAVLGSTAPIRLAAAGDSSGVRDTYTQKVRAEMREWQRKLISFNEKAEAKGKEASTAAENDLHKAWTKADIASHELQTVGAEGWKSAKITFETASRRLADAWDKVRPPGQVSGTAKTTQ